MTALPEVEYASRRERFRTAMAAAGLDTVFLPPSSDLEYLTGVERDLPSFGQIAYAHGWVTGAFFSVDNEPVFVLPRMVVTFHLGDAPPEGTIVVAETDDAEERFRDAAGRAGPIHRLGIGARTWGETVLGLERIARPEEIREVSSLVNELRRTKSPAEIDAMALACEKAERAMAAVEQKIVVGVTMSDLVAEVDAALRREGSPSPSFPTHIFAVGERTLDSGDETGRLPLREGEVVMFDFGAVHDGYCSDFGRTVVCGEATADMRRTYDVLLEAQEEGRRAARPGALARDVNAACRAPIEEAGLGPSFRHRMGHGIGLDVHERPFLSAEDETPLTEGMTFTDEPSIIAAGEFGIRIEDVIVVAGDGGRRLGSYSPDLASG